MKGDEIGTACVNDDGTIELSLGPDNEHGKELLEHIRAGVVFGLTIGMILNPAVDGKLITRVQHEKTLPELGGVMKQPPNVGNNY
jgi:hypothetical protein